MPCTCPGHFISWRVQGQFSYRKVRTDAGTDRPIDQCCIQHMFWAGCALEKESHSRSGTDPNNSGCPGTGTGSSTSATSWLHLLLPAQPQFHRSPSLPYPETPPKSQGPDPQLLKLLSCQKLPYPANSKFCFCCLTWPPQLTDDLSVLKFPQECIFGFSCLTFLLVSWTQCPSVQVSTSFA